MRGKLLDGKELAARLKSDMARRVAQLRERYARVPSLVVVLVGENPASRSYIRGKIRAAGEVGIESRLVELPESVAESELLATIAQLNADEGEDGILVQLPLPAHIDESRVIAAIALEKDVDGFHPLNVARLWRGEECTLPCTPKGIMAMLADNRIEVEGRRAVVVGRSNIVGLPMAKSLLNADATVTVAHSHTENLGAITREADILVVAVGRSHIITADMIKEGAVVIDVGINHDPTTGKLCGDVDFEACRERASYITPVPGGVGPMTICMLMANTIECFEKRLL